MPGQKHLGTNSNMVVSVMPSRLKVEAKAVLYESRHPQTGSTVAAAMRTLLVLAAIAFCGLSSAWAQSAANVDGIVHDPTGALIPKATIELKNTATGKSLTTATNRSGVFSFSGVVTGDYVLDIGATGFQTLELSDIHLDPGDQRTFSDIKLSIGTAEQSVEVTSVSGQVSTDSGEVSTLISSEDIDHLAIEGRDVTELMKILPGMAIVTNTTTFANAAYDPSIVAFSGAIGSYSSNGAPTKLHFNPD